MQDVFAFGGPVNFRGYFPNYSINATIEHNYWTWALLKGHQRNRKGSVTLRSADPLDTPEILFNFFEDGAEDDLQAIYESILLARDSFARQSVPFTEVLPGAEIQTQVYSPIHSTPANITHQERTNFRLHQESSLESPLLFYLRNRRR